VSRIDDIFASHRAAGRPVLMPFVTAGYPNLEVTREVIPALETAGAGIVELGIPFSDPIADGPVIAASMHEALLGGVTPGAVLDLVRDLRAATGLGIVAMVSYSIVHRLGPDRFAAQTAEAGVDGLIVPDVDPDGATGLAALADRHDLSFSLLVAPTTPADRIRAITDCCRGFVYVLARTGLTGEQDAAPEVTARIEEVRRHTDLPLAVGFGISSSEHVAAVTRTADGAIVGSALVRRMGGRDPVAAAVTFVGELAGGLVCG
jgi:tryptophan synthase alpha chain